MMAVQLDRFGNPIMAPATLPFYEVGSTKAEPSTRNNSRPANADILNFQRWAIANGYAPKGAKADGYFGPQTRQMINTSGMDKLMYTDQKTGKPVWAGSTGMALEQGAAIADYGNGKINQNGVINAANLSAVDNTKFDMIPKQSKGTYNDQMQAMQNAYAQQQQQQAPVVVQAPQESLARMNDPLDGTIMSDAWQRTLGYRQ
jgi:peptidoglycan hydrolase-like protein with peptidoglycan-binding domain